MERQDKGEYELLNLYNDEWEISNGILYKHCHDFRTKKELVRVPDGVKKINTEAFCHKIKSIYFPKSVEIICSDAFMDVIGLQSIFIENPQIYLEKGCFSDIDDLKEVYIAGNKIDTIVTQSYLGTDEGAGLCLEKYLGNDKVYRIDDDIKEIGAMAFSSCENLEEVVLSKSVESIGMYAFSNTDNSSLISVKLPDFLKEIGIGAFAYCNAIEEIIIPQSVTEIGKEAFAEWESWQKIYMPSHFKKLRLFQKWRNECDAEIIYY